MDFQERGDPALNIYLPKNHNINICNQIKVSIDFSFVSIHPYVKSLIVIISWLYKITIRNVH